MAIIGVWGLILFLPKKSSKRKIGGGEIFKIFKITLAANVANYVMMQIALGIDINSSKLMNIPLANFLEITIASTISFALFTIVTIALYFFVRNIENNDVKGTDKIKLIFAAGGVLILLIQILNIINILPFFINLME